MLSDDPSSTAALPRESDRSPASSARRLMEVRFPHGLPGFPWLRELELMASPGAPGPFLVLRGRAAGSPSFVAVAASDPARLLGPGEMDGAAAVLGAGCGDLLVLLMAGRGHDGSLHVNMRAPVFVDVVRKVGLQIVLRGAHHPLRAPLGLLP